MDILEKLFGSQAKVKLMKLFVFNPEVVLEKTEITKRSGVKKSKLQSELNLLEKIKLIKKKKFTKISDIKGKKSTKKNIQGYVLNTEFSYLNPLRNFLLQVNPHSNQDLSKLISKTGSIKLIILSGLFMQNLNSSMDIMVVGDKIRKTKLEDLIKKLEADLGKEIRYAILETADFQYRLSLFDHLVRDILDYPHTTILDKIGFEKE